MTEEALTHTTCDELREHMSTRGERDVTIRVEDQQGRLLGNVVTDVYSMPNEYPGTPGEYVLVIAVDTVPESGL